MSKEKYSEQQKRAIEDTLDINVSVSAGAGSGKTKVLVSRFVELLARGKAAGDEILAITFTRKAAREMRERVRSALLEILETAPLKEKPQWQKQIALMDKAQITTIDSFCHKIIRENPVESRMDPNFTVYDQFEIDEFVSQVIDDFLNKETTDGNQDLLLLLNNYTPKQVSTMLFGLTEQLDEIVSVEDISEPYKENNQDEGELRATFLASLTTLLDAKDLAGAKTKETLNQMEEMLPEVKKQLAKGAYEELAVWEKAIPKAGKVKELVVNFTEALSTLLALAIDKKALPVSMAWDKVLRNYRQILAEKMDQQEIYGFSTVAQKAVKVLEEYPEILQSYREKYKYIMVDEFQDTNQLQKNLVYLLAGGREDKLQGKRLFIVGDAKQSIYRFRGADVSVFKQVRDAIAATGGENIVMDINYRSQGAIIAACNCLFRDLLSADGTADVTAQDLVPHREKGAKPTIFTVETAQASDPAGNLTEALLVGKTLAELLAKDKNISYGDVAILLPAINLAGRFAAALGQFGIPYKILDGKGFYERQEIIDMFNLLSFLLNSRKDYNLAGILRSPYFALSDVTLTELFAAQDGHSLWETLSAAIDKKCKWAADKLRLLQKCTKDVGLREIFQAIYTVLQVEPLLLGQEFGREKLANVQKLRKLAVDFALEQGGSPADFLQRFTTLRDMEAREGTAVIEQSDKAVSIMTIHKSKGLEFPVVYLPALQSKGRSDTSGIIFRPEIGLGIKVLDGLGQMQETSVYTAAKEENSALEDSEKIRQLYVAMTRAKDYLFLSSVKNVEGHGGAGKENWFASLERVFNPQGENGKYVNWESVTAATPAVAPKEKEKRDAFTVPEATMARIMPLAGEGRKTVFSASALQEYDMCPRRYYYNYVEQMPILEPEVKGEAGHKIAPYLVGLAIHKALELKEKMPLQDAVALGVAWQDVSPEQEKILKGATETLLAKYCESPLYKETEKLPKEAEKEFSQKLFTLDGEDIYFTGSVDSLLHYSDGTVGIVDFKTGQPPVKGEGKVGYQRQLLIYAWAMEEILKTKVISAQLHFLQNLTSQDLAPDRSKQKENLKKLISEIWDKKNEQDFSVLLTGCKYCPYSYFCKKV